MKRKCRMGSLMCLLILAGVILACGGGGDREPVFKTTLALKNSTGAVSHVYNTGEPVTLELTVRNITDESRTVSIPQSLADFLILDEGAGNVLWQATLHSGPVPAWVKERVTELTFGPGESRVYNTVWTQVDNANTPVDIGNYLAQGYLGTPAELKSTSYAPTETRSPLTGFAIRNTP